MHTVSHTGHCITLCTILERGTLHHTMMYLSTHGAGNSRSHVLASSLQLKHLSCMSFDSTESACPLTASEFLSGSAQRFHVLRFSIGTMPHSFFNWLDSSKCSSAVNPRVAGTYHATSSSSSSLCGRSRRVTQQVQLGEPL